MSFNYDLCISKENWFMDACSLSEQMHFNVKSMKYGEHKNNLAKKTLSTIYVPYNKF